MLRMMDAQDGMSEPGRMTVIVGAGPAGLACALELAGDGRRVRVLEASDRVGGMCRSIELDGFVFDLGPHVLIANSHTAAGRFLRDSLRGIPHLTRPLHFAILGRDRVWASPASLLDFAGYPLRYKLGMLKARLRRRAPHGPDRTLSDHFRHIAGSPMLEEVLDPLVRKKLGVPADAVHPFWWLRPSKCVYSASDWTYSVQRRPGMRERLGGMRQSMAPSFSYPLDGYAAIPEAMLSEAEAAGASVATDCPVEGLVVRDGRIVKVICAEGELQADSVVWTAPVSSLYSALGREAPAPSETVRLRLSMLTLDTARPVRRRFLYTYHPFDDCVFNRATYVNYIFGRRSPQLRQGICLETRLTPGVAAMSKGEFRAVVESSLVRTGICPGGRIREYVEMDIDSAIPVMDAGYLEREQALFSAIRYCDNLICAGRQGNWHNCLLAEAVEQGFRAARRLRGISG